jgi:hypothetical protein
MSPTLIDEPLCKTGINLRCTFIFLGNVWHVYQFSHHGNGNPVNIQYCPLLKSIFVELSHQGRILKQKHATKSWIPTSHPVHLQLRIAAWT